MMGTALPAQLEAASFQRCHSSAAPGPVSLELGALSAAVQTRFLPALWSLPQKTLLSGGGSFIPN